MGRNESDQGHDAGGSDLAHPSRRSLLTGAGLLAGAAALGGMGATTAFAAEGDSATLDPSTATGVASADATADEVVAQTTTAGLSYRTYSLFSFRPNDQVNGFTVSSNGVWSNVADGYLVTDLDLPAGAVITEATLAVYATVVPVVSPYIGKFPLTSGYESSITTFTGWGTSGAQSVTKTGLNIVIDPEYAYFAAVYTKSTGAVAARSLRIGYQKAAVFAPVSPQARKLDTRNAGPLAGAIVGGQTKTLSLTPECPSSASSALVNLTITDTTGAGYLSLFPAGTSWPGTSSINWSGSGQTLATSVTVAVSSAGAINILGGGGGSAQVIVDLLGYYS